MNRLTNFALNNWALETMYKMSVPFTSEVPTIKLLHGPSMFAAKAKIYGALYKQFSSIAFDKTSSYWSALKHS